MVHAISTNHPYKMREGRDFSHARRLSSLTLSLSAILSRPLRSARSTAFLIHLLFFPVVPPAVPFLSSVVTPPPSTSSPSPLPLPPAPSLSLSHGGFPPLSSAPSPSPRFLPFSRKPTSFSSPGLLYKTTKEHRGRVKMAVGFRRGLSQPTLFLLLFLLPSPPTPIPSAPLLPRAGETK